MLDNYMPRAVTDPNCFLNKRHPLEGERLCPVTLEVALINPLAPFPLIDILTKDDLKFFTQENLDDGTLK